jgi:hypothetical protein
MTFNLKIGLMPAETSIKQCQMIGERVRESLDAMISVLRA